MHFNCGQRAGKFPIPANSRNHKFKHFWQILSILPTFHMQVAHTPRHRHIENMAKESRWAAGGISMEYITSAHTHISKGQRGNFARAGWRKGKIMLQSECKSMTAHYHKDLQKKIVSMPKNVCVCPAFVS